MNEKSKRMFKEIKKIENDYGIKELTEEKFESLLLKLISNDDLSKISGGTSNTKRSAAFLAALLNLNGVAETAYGQNHPAINSVPMHSVAHDKRDKDKKQHKGKKKIALASIPAALTILGLGYKYFSQQKEYGSDNCEEHSNDNYDYDYDYEEHSNNNYEEHSSDNYEGYIECDESKIEKILKDISDKKFLVIDCDIYSEGPPFTLEEGSASRYLVVKRPVRVCKCKPLYILKYQIVGNKLKLVLSDKKGTLSNEEFTSKKFTSVSIPSTFHIGGEDSDVYILENDDGIYKKGTELFKKDFILRRSVFDGLRLAYPKLYKKANPIYYIFLCSSKFFQDIPSNYWFSFAYFKEKMEQIRIDDFYEQSDSGTISYNGKKYKIDDSIYDYLRENTNPIETEPPSKINENLYKESSFKKAIKKFKKPLPRYYKVLDFESFEQQGFVPANLAVAILKDKVLEHSYNIQMVASQLNCQESVNDNFSLICDQHGDPTQGPTARSVDFTSWLRSEFDELSGKNRPRITKKFIEEIEADSVFNPCENIYKNGYLKIYNAENTEKKKKLVKLIGKYPADNYCTQKVTSDGKGIAYKLAFISAASYQGHAEQGLEDYIVNFLLLYPQFENNFLDAINTAKTLNATNTAEIKKGKIVIDHLTGVGQGAFKNPVGLDKLIIYLLARKYAHHIAKGNLLFMLHQCINYENLDSIFGKGDEAPEEIQELARSVIMNAKKYGYDEVITELGNLCEENKKLSYDQAINELQSTFGKEVDLPKALFDIVKVFGDIGGSQPNESDAAAVSNDPGDIRNPSGITQSNV